MVDDSPKNDRYRELLKQARGDKPVEATPGTGFSREQFTSYPLSRIGPNMYVTQIEAVVPSADNQDYLIIDPEEMEDYAFREDPTSEDFQDSTVRYHVRGLDYAEGSIDGGARMVYRDPDPRFEEMAEANPELQKREEYPNVVLATNNNLESFLERGLGTVEKMLTEEDTIIRVLGS